MTWIGKVAVDRGETFNCWALAIIASAVVICTLSWPSESMAGQYSVRQCNVAASFPYESRFASDAVRGPANSIRYATGGVNCANNINNALRIRSISDAVQGDQADWRWVAPPGTRFVFFDASINYSQSGGHVPELFFQNANGVDRLVAQIGSTADWLYRYDIAPRDVLLARLRCSLSAGCPHDSDAAASIRSLWFTVEDFAAPTLSMSGTLFTQDWPSVGGIVNVSASDQGSGVAQITVRRQSRQGLQLGAIEYDCGSTTAATDTLGLRRGVAHRLRGCAFDDESPATEDAEPRTPAWYIPVSTLPEGIYPIVACARDLAHFGLGLHLDNASPNETCVEREVKIDRTPPAGPIGFQLEGGSGWRTSNSFDLSWTTPTEGNVAPIDAIRYRISSTGSLGDQYDTGVREVEGVGELRGIQVPGGPGEYEIRLWLEDAAGNNDPSSMVSAMLRFDPTVPPASAPDKYNGFISRDEFPYPQTWDAVSLDEVPISGLHGFAVRIDRSENLDPCVTPSHPSSSCDELEITHLGSNNRSLSVSDLDEGQHFVHVVTVAGNGLRSAEVKRTQLRVDKTDPIVSIADKSDEWNSESVQIVASAFDSYSGMSPDDDASDDPPPQTYIQVNGNPEIGSLGDSASVAIDSEGIHQVGFWARDLAGNTSAKRFAEVRIDKTPPTVALRPIDPSDPELLRAVVSDGLSGVEATTIGYRPQGGSWVELPVEAHDGFASVRIDSQDLPDGLYELRVRATDHAGNVATSSDFEGGTPAIVGMPMKQRTKLGLSLVKSKTKLVSRVRVAYGKPAVAVGRLTTDSGQPVADTTIRIVSRFAKGAKKPVVVKYVKTTASGDFRARLGKGPRRTVTAYFDGDPARFDIVSSPVKVEVVGQVKLSGPKRLRGKRLVLTGRIGGRNIKRVKGRIVEVQVKIGAGWSTVKSALHTDSKGRFKLRYRFSQSYPTSVRFQFRARLPRQGNWPYKPVVSRPLKVTLMP